MRVSVIMPQLGETVAEGKVLTWFKSVGDEIQEGEDLFEVETDKVTVEVPSMATGRLSEIRVSAGTIAKVGEVVAVIGGEGAANATDKSVVPSPKRAGPARGPFQEVMTPTDKFGSAKGPDGARVTPLARRLIAQNGLDIAAVAAELKQRGGTKIDERVVRSMLTLATAAASSSALAPRPDVAREDGDFVMLSNVRLKTAERLAESWRTIPHVFQAIEIDFTAIDRVRKTAREAFKQAHGFSLTYLPFIARATCLALRVFPQVNSKFDGKSLVVSRAINLGIAVDLSHKGLVVPVVHDAGEQTLTGLAKSMQRQIDKAKAGKLRLDDLSGGTYSITNNGAFGTLFTAPIINAPQVAILSIDAIRLRPAVVSMAEGDFIAPRMLGMIGQSFDHRAFDGAYSAAFLSELKKIIEERNWGEELA